MKQQKTLIQNRFDRSHLTELTITYKGQRRLEICGNGDGQNVPMDFHPRRLW